MGRSLLKGLLFGTAASVSLLSVVSVALPPPLPAPRAAVALAVPGDRAVPQPDSGAETVEAMPEAETRAVELATVPEATGDAPQDPADMASTTRGEIDVAADAGTTDGGPQAAPDATGLAPAPLGETDVALGAEGTESGQQAMAVELGQTAAAPVEGERSGAAPDRAEALAPPVVEVAVAPSDAEETARAEESSLFADKVEAEKTRTLVATPLDPPSADTDPTEAPVAVARDVLAPDPEPSAVAAAQTRLAGAPLTATAPEEGTTAPEVVASASPTEPAAEPLRPAVASAPETAVVAASDDTASGPAPSPETVAEVARRLALSAPVLSTEAQRNLAPLGSRPVAEETALLAALRPEEGAAALALRSRPADPAGEVATVPEAVAVALSETGPETAPAAPTTTETLATQRADGPRVAALGRPETIGPASYPALAPLREDGPKPVAPQVALTPGATVRVAQTVEAVASRATGPRPSATARLRAAHATTDAPSVHTRVAVAPVADAGARSPWPDGVFEPVAAQRSPSDAIAPTPGVRLAVAAGTGARLVGTELPTPPGVVALAPEELPEEAPAEVTLAQATPETGTPPVPGITGFGTSVQPLTQRSGTAGVRVNRLGGAATPSDSAPAGTMPEVPRAGGQGLPGQGARRITVGAAPGPTLSAPETGAAAEAGAVEAPTGPAYLRNAVPFDGGDAALLAVVLLDPAEDEALSRQLAALDLPISVAVAPGGAALQAAAKIYADARKEVVLAGAGLPDGATPQDAEVAFSVHFASVPNALGVLAPQSGGFAADRDLAQHVLQILAADGHGLLMWDQGLSPLRSQAERSARPTAMVYRQIDSRGAGTREIARRLDRAAFEARRGTGVVVVGEARPETLDALQDWARRARGGEVVFAPLSTLLKTR